MRWIAALSLTLLATPALAAPSWGDVLGASSWTEYTTKNHADAGEVRVLRTTIGGVACFKGEATTDVPPELLLQVAADIPATRQWSSAGVAEAELLSQSGDTMEYYQYLDVPGWTLSADRFWFLRGHTERAASGAITFWWERLIDGGAHRARWDRVHAEHEGAIEPPVNVGGWVFTPTGSGTSIQYFICTDTGGSIPHSVQNAATTKTLPDTLGDLVREGHRRQ